MEAIENLKDLIFPKLTELGLRPLCCYYGGSLLNGTYSPEKSDLDIVVVINGRKSYCSAIMKLVSGGGIYSLLFDFLWEYGEKGKMKEVPNPRLYGYLNSFDLSREDIAFEGNSFEIVDNVLSFQKNNAKIAAKELIKRELNAHPSRKEDYHLLRAINISGEYDHDISFNDIIDCKNGKIPLELILKKEGFL